jgi:hypothetical protein
MEILMMRLPSVSLRAHPWKVLGLVVATTAVLAVGLRGPKPRQPQSLDDVLKAARELRLVVRGDAWNGAIGNRLILSETSSTESEVSEVGLGVPGGASRRGKVALYIDDREETDLLRSQPENAVLWGRYFVYGDAALVRRLLNHR